MMKATGYQLGLHIWLIFITISARFVVLYVTMFNVVRLRFVKKVFSKPVRLVRYCNAKHFMGIE